MGCPIFDEVRVMQPERIFLPDWPRLMAEPQAAAYLSISPSTLRKDGPAARRHGRRVLYDRHDLDRWADALAGQPLDTHAREAEAAEVERKWRARRTGNASH